MINLSHELYRRNFYHLILNRIFWSGRSRAGPYRDHQRVCPAGVLGWPAYCPWAWNLRIFPVYRCGQRGGPIPDLANRKGDHQPPGRRSPALAWGSNGLAILSYSNFSHRYMCRPICRRRRIRRHFRPLSLRRRNHSVPLTPALSPRGEGVDMASPASLPSD